MDMRDGAAAGGGQETLGIYVSVPFCRSKCTYCNFASGVYPAGEHARYVDRLTEDLAAAGGWAARLGAEMPRRVDTIYLGGGTPSLLEPELLERLFAAIRTRFDVQGDAEITVECAPGQLADSTLEALVRGGVNRVSLGVQSFVDAEAKGSGRLHDRATVERDLRRLREAGIGNLNVDLIAGLAGQTAASWEESLDALIGAGVPHASVYMLEVDEDSRLGRELLAGGTRYRAGLVPDDDAIARMYARAIERLAAAGIEQYEISNFSRAGFESRHNLRYWRRRPYLGVGLDASSMLRADWNEEQDCPEDGAGEASHPCGKSGRRMDGAPWVSADGAADGAGEASHPCGKSGRMDGAPWVSADGAADGAGEASHPCGKSGRMDGAPWVSADRAADGAGEASHPCGKSGRMDGAPWASADGATDGAGEASHPCGGRYALRSATTADLHAYLDAAETAETAWLSPARQHEEAWFLGLRLNAGVKIAEVEREFGRAMVEPALKVVDRLIEDGMLACDGETVRLTERGRLLSNDVFQEFLVAAGTVAR